MGKNMRDRFFALLGVVSGEESMVSMLLMQSVFLGIFFGAFDISAHSLFLSIFDEKMMARGYVVSGIAGIILTSLYTWLQTKMQFKNFAIINLFFVTALTIILWITLILSPAKWVIFIVFIMLGPLNILAMLGFWGTTGRLFTLRQGKRLFGLVDAGLIIGIIVSCYTIPILLSFKFESHNILLFSASSILVAAIIQIMIGSRFRIVTGSGEQQPEKTREKKSFITVFREDPYTRIMGIFIALSVVTAFFVQYSFMAVTREQYPAEEDMARFLGIFTGSMMIFTLLIKLLVFSYVIRNYGLRTCLAISPILIAVFTAVAITIGMLMGYTPESTSGFLIFFLLLALSRLFSKSLKDSIESPSFKVIYQTIDEEIRYEVQSGMDGTVNEIAALTSGLLLAGLGVLSFIKLIHFSWVLFFIILIWVFVAFRLYSEYRKSIRKALETVRHPDSESGTLVSDRIFNSRFYTQSEIKTDYFSLISGDYSVLEKNRNTRYFENLIKYSEARQDIGLLPVLKKIAIIPDIDEEVRKHSSETVKNLEYLSSSGKSEDEKTSSAKKILSGTRQPQTTEILRLLRDNSIESKRIGIFMIGKFKLSDMLPEVCECLNIPGLETDASTVLRTFGSSGVDELMRFYLVSSGNTVTSKTILRLLGKSATEESMGFLFSRLWSNSRQLKEVAVNCLIDCEFQTSGEDKDRLHQYISDIVGLMTWNISAKTCLENNNNAFLLKEMEKEINRWKRFLFNILSITYDSGSIAKIKENLESETVESVNYALEMIDLVIDESIKPKLISLLDAVSDEDKLKNLFQFFPGEVPQIVKLQEDIINRDYNFLSLWTKACTLRNLPEIEGDEMAESVIALLFSPERIMQEEAAKLIVRSSRELYKSASHRIPDLTKKRLDKIVNGEINEEELLFEKIRFLSNCFPGIIEEELLSMASYMQYADEYKTESPLFANSCIIWSFSVDKQDINVHIRYSDQHNGDDKKVTGKDNYSYYVLPLTAVEEFNYQFPDKASEILKFIDKNEG
jgi:ATP:ADP antiporter, AAA family